mmetsp:Transcript_119683/g.349994  ORF Transcript_119683/g.349994 Transcript_119683/m.349994 type:complete len:337 (-) Transcript_119683:809-1819(-)
MVPPLLQLRRRPLLLLEPLPLLGRLFGGSALLLLAPASLLGGSPLLLLATAPLLLLAPAGLLCEAPLLLLAAPGLLGEAALLLGLAPRLLRLGLALRLRLQPLLLLRALLLGLPPPPLLLLLPLALLLGRERDRLLARLPAGGALRVVLHLHGQHGLHPQLLDGRVHEGRGRLHVLLQGFLHLVPELPQVGLLEPEADLIELLHHHEMLHLRVEAPQALPALLHLLLHRFPRRLLLRPLLGLYLPQSLLLLASLPLGLLLGPLDGHLLLRSASHLGVARGLLCLLFREDARVILLSQAYKICYAVTLSLLVGLGNPSILTHHPALLLAALCLIEVA